MSAEQILHLLAGMRVYDLAHPMEQGMPQSPNHPQFHLTLARRHGDRVRPGGGSAANELIVTGGHVGTHIDAFCHVSQDGSLYGGVDADEAQRGGRFRELGVETVEPVVCRGVLLDVAGERGVEVLPPGYAITADDLLRAAARGHVDVRPGDAILVRTGWARNWGDPASFVGQESGVPGPGVEAAQWICDAGARLTGTDTLAYEVIPSGVGHRYLPVHGTLLVERGVHIIECLQLEELARDQRWEFLFVAAPLKLVGATGSPLRPLAIA